MAKAIFTRDFEFDFRPNAAVCRVYKASDEPQSVKREVLEAAVVAGVATEFKEPPKQPRSKSRSNNDNSAV